MKKYMVMECRLSYAVVLDEDGRFLKVANCNYEVGQTVTDVIEMQTPQSAPNKKQATKWIYSLAALAACMVLAVTSIFQMRQLTYASVYMRINPEVRIDVNRKDIVVGIDGMNADGDDLIDGYRYKKKNLELVMDELTDRAIEMGYLHEGGQISLVLDADSDEWVVSHKDTLSERLNEHLSEKLTVTIDITDKGAQSNQVVIPVEQKEEGNSASDYEEDAPTMPPASSEENDSGYDGVDSDDGQTDYGDFHEDPSGSGGNENSAAEAREDGVSDYGVSDYEDDDIRDDDDSDDDWEEDDEEPDDDD